MCTHPGVSTSISCRLGTESGGDKDQIRNENKNDHENKGMEKNLQDCGEISMNARCGAM
jgi:hypothetical protein